MKKGLTSARRCVMVANMKVSSKSSAESIPVEERINAITSRHVGRCLSQLEEVGTPAVSMSAVKREFWYLADDIKQVVSQSKEE